MTQDMLRNEIRSFIGEKRLPHVWGTEAECKRLAKLFSLSQEDTDQLCAAALLHDITKYFSVSEHRAYMERIGKPIDESFLRSEKTLHALTGAFFAREHFPEVTTDTVFSAILFHTTGKADMSLVQKLLYLADYIEPTRTFSDCVALRRYFYDNITGGERLRVLNETLIRSFDMTISDLITQRCPIHPDTVAARNDLVSQEKCQ